MSELDKLEQYLKEHDYPYERIDEEGRKIPGYKFPFGSRHQLIVYGDKEKSERLWDAICHYGSYGFEQGLIEVMGESVVRSKEDSVEGYLTAEEIIQRLEEKNE
jgi:hypothetical protein